MLDRSLFTDCIRVALPNGTDKLKILFSNYALKDAPDNRDKSHADRAKQIVLNYLHKYGLPTGFDFERDYALIYYCDSALEPKELYLDVRFVSMRDYETPNPLAKVEPASKEEHKYPFRATIKVNGILKEVDYDVVDEDTIEYMENGCRCQTHYKSIVEKLEPL